MVTSKKQIRALQAAAESVIEAAKGQATDPNAILKLDQVLIDVATVNAGLKALTETVNALALAVAEASHTKPKK